HEGGPPPRQPRAAAPDRRWQGPHRPGLAHADELQAPAQVEGADRAQGVPGSLALHGRPGRLGGSRRLRARLGDEAREGARRGLMPKNPPEGYPRVSPYLYYEDGAAAIDWLTQAFGFTERLRVPGEGGRVMHAEIELD